MHAESALDQIQEKVTEEFQSDEDDNELLEEDPQEREDSKIAKAEFLKEQNEKRIKEVSRVTQKVLTIFNTPPSTEIPSCLLTDTESIPSSSPMMPEIGYSIFSKNFEKKNMFGNHLSEEQKHHE